MKPSERVVSFPIMGKAYAEIAKKYAEALGLKVITPPPITDKTIKLGVRHSPDMMCFPYKVTLGTIIEALELGANTIITYANNVETRCRQELYPVLQEYQLNRIGGYEFEMFPIGFQNLISRMHKVSGRSRLHVTRVTWRFLKEVQTVSHQVWATDRLNIGIIGEIYCCCDEKVNYGLEGTIRKYGANPFNACTVSEFFDECLNYGWASKLGPLGFSKLFRRDPMKPYLDIAKGYVGKIFAGHGKENIAYLHWLVDKGIDGIIHVLPLSCMPETTIEPFINGICEDAEVPLLRIAIDENNSEANLDTRVETFIKLIQWNKQGELSGD